MQGSPRFSLNMQELEDLARLLAISGGSAALLVILQELQAVNFGFWNSAVALLLTVAVKAVHQWAADNSKSKNTKGELK